MTEPKIEVLLSVPSNADEVPEKGPTWCCTACEWSAYLFAGGHVNDTWLPPKDKRPALLAALLEDAGAVKVELWRADDYNGSIRASIKDNETRNTITQQNRHSFWILPVKDGGTG